VINKKIIVSLLTLGLLAAVVSAGTWAYFSDTRIGSNDSITAGTIILNGINATASYVIPNAAPGDTNLSINNVTVTNAGTLPGNLYVNITSPTTTTEGGQNLLSHIHFYLNGQPATTGTSVKLGELQPGNANSLPVAITYSYDNLMVPQNSEQGQTVKFDIKYCLVQSINMPANVTINP
jgi:predicted ribosomally synthesized peptide with SipW-like signal peptide